VDFESLVERRIREATERGDFDGLPGAGKPLELHDVGDPDWWFKQYTRRNAIDTSMLVPPTVALRREADGFPESLTDLTTPEQVRAVLTDFNERVRADWRRPSSGPSLPFAARQVDVEAMLARWQQLTGYRDAPPTRSAATVLAAAPDRSGRGRPHRWTAIRRLFRRATLPPR
jgi:hypothetical protein